MGTGPLYIIMETENSMTRLCLAYLGEVPKSARCVQLSSDGRNVNFTCVTLPPEGLEICREWVDEGLDLRELSTVQVIADKAFGDDWNFDDLIATVVKCEGDKIRPALADILTN